MGTRNALFFQLPSGGNYRLPFSRWPKWSLRKIQAITLQRWFTEDAEHVLRIKCFQALAFVPPDDIIQRFEDFVTAFSDEDEQHLRECIDYFETTWIVAVCRRSHRQPLFLIRCWNVFYRVQNHLTRTNNNIKMAQCVQQACVNIPSDASQIRQENYARARFQQNAD